MTPPVTEQNGYTRGVEDAKASLPLDMGRWITPWSEGFNEFQRGYTRGYLDTPGTQQEQP